jgi:mannose-6-phosphate isomerase-like protein (cupin superfamily)
MSRKLTTEEATGYGIYANHEIMSNGELRFRLTGSDGSSYIRTHASDIGAWQRSHVHHSTREVYIVQSGWMCLASIVKGVLNLRICQSGELVEINPMIPHNVYLPAKAMIHTVKHGLSGKDDRFAVPELDELVLGLSEEQLVQQAASVMKNEDSA